jgi:hypothetical protein
MNLEGFSMSEISSLHGTTVAEIFSSGLENIEQIEAVAVSVLWKDGSVTAGHSNTSQANVALLVLAMDQYQRRWFDADT